LEETLNEGSKIGGKGKKSGKKRILEKRGTRDMAGKQTAASRNH